MKSNLESINPCVLHGNHWIELIRYCLSTTLVILYFILVIDYQYSFTYIIEFNKHAYLLLGSLLIFTISEILAYNNIKSLFFLKAVIILFLTLVLAFELNSLHNEHLIVIYSSVFILFTLTNLSISHIIFILVGTQTIFLFELFVIIFQFVTNQFASFTSIVGGTFHNSGITSCFFIVNLPIFKYVLIEKYHLPKVIYYCILIITAIFVLLLRSRTAIIALAGIMVVDFLGFNLKFFATVFAKWKISVIVLLVVIGLALTFKKQGSTYGRLLLWNIAFHNCTDNLWTGIGIGNLSYLLPIWQAEYFKESKNIQKDFIKNADESYLIYNEFIELVVEVGVIGLSITLLFIFWFLRSGGNNVCLLITQIRQSFIAILFCAFTSYPLHCNYVLFLMAAYIAILLKNIPGFQQNIRGKLFLFVCYAVLLVKSFNYCMSIEKWKTIVFSSMTRSNRKLKYLEIFSELKLNGKFLINYGNFLALDESDADSAIKILEKSKGYFTSGQTYQSLELLYVKKNEINNAIHNLTFLTFLYPNRFYPKYRLAKLHLRAGNHNEAKKILDDIISMPIKINSIEVMQIKKKSELLLDSLSSRSPR